MLYVVELMVPENTPDISPKKVEVELPQGVITQIEVHFPPGVRGTVKTAMFKGHYQVFPRPFGTWLTGDAETIRAQLFYEIRATKERFTIYGKSPGANYPHLITWRITVLPKHVALPSLFLASLGEALNKLLTLFSRGG